MFNRITDRMCGTAGLLPILKDIDNTMFTDYIPTHLESLVRYAKTLEGIDPERAEDLVHDVWYSYKMNEEDGKCFSYSGGHAAFISVEEAVKARMKKMLHKKHTNSESDYMYLSNTKGSQMQFTSFMEPESEEDEDSLQSTVQAIN